MILSTATRRIHAAFIDLCLRKNDPVLSFFRNNQVTTTIPLAIYVVLLHLAAWLGYVHPPEVSGAEGGLLYRTLCSWITESHIFSAATATLLVFIQSLLVNNIADEFRLLGERNWLPGLFYALVASSLPDFILLSPPLIAATFIPISMRRILKAYKIPNATALIFDAAFWMAVGSLFYPPAFFLLLAAYAGINVMRSFNIREQLVFITGVCVPFFLCWLGYFWYDQGGAFFQTQFGGLFGWYGFSMQMNLETMLKAGLLALLFLAVLLSYSAHFYRKLIQAQKCIAVLYWFLFIGGLAVLLRNDPSPAYFLLLMPSTGIFLSMSVSGLRNRLIAEIIHLAILGAVVFIQFYPK